MTSNPTGDRRVRLAESASDIGAAVPVLRQLRPQYHHAQMIERIGQQRLLGYQLACLWDDNEVCAVGGFIVGEKLAWGKHIYIDDFVTDEAHRSRGYGTALLHWLIEHARELGCAEVRLDSGVQRFAAHRFYLREGFDILSHHFALTGLDNG